MKIVQINSVPSGSTGRIMLNIAETVRENGGVAYTFSENRKVNNLPETHRAFGYRLENLFHRGFSMITGISGMGSVIGTRKLLRQLDDLAPDVLHLHNLHGWYINIPMLFNYIRKKKIKTVWTLHDCWAFTAQCSHFTMEKCDKWKTGCFDCPRYKLYPYTWVDRTRQMYKLKKAWLTGVENMTIVTPSAWLADLVKQSFLKDYPVKVINNGINLSIFQPTPSDFRERYKLTDKKVILGVASGWSYRKGLDVFIELFHRLDPDIYKIVLVGTDDKIDKQLPEGIISIHRTQNQRELAQIYTAADVFVTPTREENFPTVNMEAIACGTPVVTFDTGGSSEAITPNTGLVVGTENNMLEITRQVMRVCEEQPFLVADCVNRAQEYDAKKKFFAYYKLYCQVVHTGDSTI